MPAWERKIILLIMFGLCAIYFSYLAFPKLPAFTVADFIGGLLYHPYRLLGAAVLFIFGFLAHAYVVRKLIARVKVYQKKLKLEEYWYLLLLLFSYGLIFLVSAWLAVVALGFSLVYGIMDVDFEKKKAEKRREKDM